MTVQELINQLVQFDADAEIVLYGADHSYVTTMRAEEAEAEPGKNRGCSYPEYFEWYENNNQGDPVKVILIY